MYTKTILATIEDLKEICKFTDFWLAGRGLKCQAPGAVNDCFISPSQHTKYITKYETYVIKLDGEIIGWSVIQLDGSLIHLLIAGKYRNLGLGTMFLNQLRPKRIHSKSDQTSGDPGPFYEKHGYSKVKTVKSKSRLDIEKIRPNRKANIDIYERA